MNLRGEYADIQAGNNSVIFPITLQMGDIINPSTVKTSYSKTITLPRTDTNDKIFSQYFKLDKLVHTDSFNALEKTPFTLFINGSEKLFEGWIKLNKITKDGYEINLLSNEGKLFNTLAEKNLNDLDIDLTHKIGRTTIWNGWNSDEAQYEYLKYCPAYQGLYTNFTSNKTLNATGSGVIDLDNDLDEYQKFELRSYYQHPAIKLSKLIQQIAIENNIEIATEDFFTNTNPYWDKLFMINPKYFNVDKPTSIFKPTYRSDQAGMGQYITNSSGSVTTNTVGRAHSTTIYDDFDMESSYRLDLSKYPAGTLEINWEFDIEIETIVPQEIVNNTNISYLGLTYIKPEGDWSDIQSGNLVIQSYINGQNNVYSRNFILWHLFSPYEQYDFNITHNPATYGSWQKIRFALVGSDYYPGTFTPIGPIYNSIGTYYRVKGSSIINNDGTDVYISFDLKGFNPLTNTYTNPAFRNAGYYTDVKDKCYYKNIQLRYRVIENENLKITVKPYSDQIRSNYKLTKDNLLDASITQSQFLLNYMKLFGLMCYYDKTKSKYVLCTRNKFYESATNVDWTHKVNPDEIELEPNNIEARKYTFKYGDLNTTHYNRYKDVFGVEYGSVYINTNNQHLDNTEEFYTSLFSCPLMEQSYNFDNTNVQYRLPWKALNWCTYEGIKRSSSIPDKPTLMFWNGLKIHQFTMQGTKPWLILSDDNYVMRTQNEYFWSNYPQNGDTLDSVILCYNENNVPVFPGFTSYIPYTAALDFAVPKLTFFETESNALTDDICLYNRFYEGYVNDKLSIHNRIVEIPVNLNNNDILNFKFNNFYIINNTPFVVIEIKDYNPMSNQPTIVKMQRVVDTNNYTNGQNILVNDIRSIDGLFNLITQDGEDPASTDLYCEYAVPNQLLVTESGFNINGVNYPAELTYPDILLTVTRPYQSDYVLVKPYIIYDGLTYYGDEQKMTFIPYTATFSNFIKTEVGDNYELSIEYVTNTVVVSQGYLINGQEVVVVENTSPIVYQLINDAYNVIGWIKTDYDTYIYSNNYYIN